MKLQKNKIFLKSLTCLFVILFSFLNLNAQNINNGNIVNSKWYSFSFLFSSTHHKITKEALKKINKDYYRDIGIASHLLVMSSALERGHPNIIDNGGPVKEIWEVGNKKNPGGVLKNYKQFRFIDAYENLGVICHLTQDQAVPAHVANIKHFPFDWLERYASYAGKFGEIPYVENDKEPYEYYQICQDETRSKLPKWINPKTGIPFWIASSNAPRLGEDVTLGPYGSYGGGKDSYAYWEDESDPYDDGYDSVGRKMVSLAPEITTEQLSQAVAYTRAVLESASKKLPPLVKDMKLSKNIIQSGEPLNIDFIVIDNRSKKVKVKVVIIKDEKIETIFNEVVVLNNPYPRGFNTSDSDDDEDFFEELPETKLFHRYLNIKWNGEFRGKSVVEGTYRVRVIVTDEDGNTVPSDVNNDTIEENDSVRFFSVLASQSKLSLPSF